MRETERRRVEKIAHETAPDAKIIGAATPGKSWDIRPVVATEGKEGATDQRTSIIRFFGPECSLVLDLHSRVESELKRLSQSNPSPSILIAYGSLEGQLWYRRAQIPEVLSEKLRGDRFQNGQSFPFPQALRIAKGMLAAARNLHGRGIIHGHIVPNNVFVAPSGDIGLIDPLFAIAAYRASIALATPELISGYDPQTLAPELLNPSWPEPSIDTFGIGKTFWELFRAVKRGDSADENVMSSADLSMIRELIFAMTDESPSVRPTLDEVADELKKCGRRSAPKRETAPEAEQPKREITPAPVPPPRQVTPAPVPPVREAARPVEPTQLEKPREERVRDRTKTENLPPERINELRAKHSVNKLTRPQSATASAELSYSETGSSKHEVQAPLGAFAVKSRILRSGGNAAPEPAQQGVKTQSYKPGVDNRRENIGEVFFSLDDTDTSENERARRAAMDAVFENVDGDAFQPQSKIDNPREIRPPADQSSKFRDQRPPRSRMKDDQEGRRETMVRKPFVQKQEESFFDHEDELEQESKVDVFEETGIESEDIHPVTEDVEEETKAKPRRLGLLFLIFGLLVVAWIFTGRGEDDGDIENAGTPSELRLAWDSTIPSRMKDVAVIAVSDHAQSRAAQDIVVSSAFRGDKSSAVLGGGGDLLRIAFDKRWELELSPADRREATRFATISFLGEQAFSVPQGTSIESLHPGVILALAATLQEAGGKLLNTVPAVVLGKLPHPLGAAFAELSQTNPALTVGDVGVRRLARLAAGEEISAESLKQFLSADTASRLRAVAQLGSGDKVLAAKILGILFGHPNIKFEGDAFNWARVSKLISWEELDSSDQLLTLSGIVPSSEVAVAHIPWLRGHPSPGMRQFALQQSLDRVKLGHPGGVEILSALKDQPDALSPSQTFDLAWVLQSPRSVTSENARKWLETEVPLGVLERMVVNASQADSPALVDIEVMNYLQARSWEPTIDVLEKLAHSPQRYFRLFAYWKLNKIPDKNAVLAILQRAFASESDPELKKQLEQMIMLAKRAAR